jgi:hypothetical protein
MTIEGQKVEVSKDGKTLVGKDGEILVDVKNMTAE